MTARVRWTSEFEGLRRKQESRIGTKKLKKGKKTPYHVKTKWLVHLTKSAGMPEAPGITSAN